MYTEVVLADKRDREVAKDAGVDTDTEPADVVADDGSVEIVEVETREPTVDEPERYGNDEADEICVGYPGVDFADAEELVWKATPCNCLS